jgi:hypothetical protein
VLALPAVEQVLQEAAVAAAVGTEHSCGITWDTAPSGNGDMVSAWRRYCPSTSGPHSPSPPAPRGGVTVALLDQLSHCLSSSSERTDWVSSSQESTNF